MKITKTIAKKLTRARQAFSLLEALLAVAVLSMVAAVGVFTVNSLTESTTQMKLHSDVATINGAVRTYLVNGGQIPDAATGGDVIARLQTGVEAASAKTLAGLRGTMLDRRLRGVAVSAAGVDRAVWNPGQQRFEISSTGDGFASFDLGGDDAGTPGVDTRRTTMALASRDAWIWDYQNGSPTRSAPGHATAGEASLAEPTPPTAVTRLLAPDFSRPGDLYDLSAFTPELLVSLIDRNDPGTATLMYSINGSPWEAYHADRPLRIPPEDATAVRAYAVPAGEGDYEESELRTETYETIFFTGVADGQFHSPAGDPGLVTNLTGTARGPQFLWGSPATTPALQNELNFTGAGFNRVAPDEEFQLGTLTYTNSTTRANTNATAVQIAIDMNMTQPAMRETLNFEFRLLSTPNRGLNADDDADFVWIPDVSTNFRTVIKGRTYSLVLRFGEHSANGFTTIDTFHAHEGKTLSGTIYGRLTEVR